MLFGIAFVESSLAPIAPDLLLIPLSVVRPKRSLYFAFICVAGSTLGAVLGYFIGYIFYDQLGSAIVGFFGWEDAVNGALLQYQLHGWQVLLFAGFTPIPFQVFTIVAGFGQAIDLQTFMLATFTGRALRFMFVGGVLFVFGPGVKDYLDNHLAMFTAIATLLIVVWILIVKCIF